MISCLNRDENCILKGEPGVRSCYLSPPNLSLLDIHILSNQCTDSDNIVLLITDIRKPLLIFLDIWSFLSTTEYYHFLEKNSGLTGSQWNVAFLSSLSRSYPFDFLQAKITTYLHNNLNIKSVQDIFCTKIYCLDAPRFISKCLIFFGRTDKCMLLTVFPVLASTLTLPFMFFGARNWASFLT